MGKNRGWLGTPHLIRQLHGLLEATMAVELVVGSHANSLEICRDTNAGEVSLEGLFVDVGMTQDSSGEDLVTAGSHHLPTIGVVIPALVVVEDGDPEEADTLPGLPRGRPHHLIGLRLRSHFAFERDLHDVGFARAGCRRNGSEYEHEA
jgi:hypothetical protein